MLIYDSSVKIADLSDVGATKLRLDNKAGNDAIVDPADLTVVELGIIGGPAGSVPQGTHLSVRSSIDFGFTTVTELTAKGGYSWSVTRDGQLVASASNSRYAPNRHPRTPVSPDFAFDANFAGNYTMKLTVTKLDGTTVTSEESFTVAPMLVVS